MTNNIVTAFYNSSDVKSKIYESFDREYSYNEVIKKAKQIASILQRYEQKNILVHVDHSILSLTTIIAIWQLNKTFIPVNTNTSLARLKNIRSQLNDFIEVNFNDIKKDNTINITNKLIENVEEFSEIFVDEKEIAYILFTSGTTGNPKGVKITHNNLITLFKNTKDLFDFNSNDVWINLHSLEFDFSIWELFGALLNHSSLVLPGDIKLYQFDEISKLIKKYDVNVLNQTPTAFYRLQKYLQSSNVENLKYVIFGGEKLQVEMIKESFEKYSRTRFINMYGITEITIHATYHQISEIDFLSPKMSNIGRGIGESKVFLVDESKNPIENGVGEICISSGSVSPGYLNNGKLSSEVFIDYKGLPTYFSGDIGEYIEGKDINYIGRKDNQIEKNGYRIELDEIKYNLQKHNNVIQCEMDYYDEQIIAYLVLKDNISDDHTYVFNNWLDHKIPTYMIPNKYVQIKEMPLTQNGKIDIKMLRSNTNTKDYLVNTGDSFVEWFKETLEDYTKIPKDKIKNDANFFDMGISSLQLIDIHNKIIKNFAVNKEFSVVDLFQFSSVQAITTNFVMGRK
ncbi:hypothetical protein COJ48_11160 [Bacillus cereus]|nr:hypothetical protein COJ48_11160 [Bacillus cereus]PGP75141.1 hypothetical protein CN997_26215 [Bacillus cereus]